MSNALSQTEFLESAEVRLNFERLAEAIGPLAYEEIKARDLLVVAAKLQHQLELTDSEKSYLAEVESLPLLGKLVELKCGPLSQVTLRPLALLPVTALIQKEPQRTAIEKLLERTRTLLTETALTEPLSIALDSWVGAVNFERRLELLARIGETFITEKSISFVGPSSGEILEILNQEKLEASLDNIGQLLEQLAALKIHSVQGGFDLTVHQAALNHGFSVCVGQPIEAQGLNWSKNFLTRLSKVATLQSSYAGQITWFPWAPYVMDGPESSGPLAFDVLRSISLARLLLPPETHIRAPLSLLGPKLSHVALGFGANDLGFAAVDELSAKMLGVRLLSEVETLINSHAGFGRLKLSRVATFGHE